jgi:hypothetical protein
VRVSWLAIVVAALCLNAGAADPPAAQTGLAAPQELLARPYLYEVTRHLYRWYLDERDLDPLTNCREFVFWVRALQPALDPNDRSRFGEIILPQLSVRVKLKLADYTIPELDTVVKSDTFKIVAVSRTPCEDQPPPGCTEVRVDYAQMREELYRTRREARFPEGELLERLRAATRQELLKDTERWAQAASSDRQIVHLAPLSPVANETWVFWESGRMLIRFASDIDLANAAVWEHEELAVRTYDVDRQVAVSLDEAAGSNAYLTRAQVGRALYNCIVLGRRLELQPPPGGPQSQPSSAAPTPAADSGGLRTTLTPLCSEPASN